LARRLKGRRLVAAPPCRRKTTGAGQRAALPASFSKAEDGLLIIRRLPRRLETFSIVTDLIPICNLFLFPLCFRTASYIIFYTRFSQLFFLIF
jgi:hypothetical protein